MATLDGFIATLNGTTGNQAEAVAAVDIETGEQYEVVYDAPTSIIVLLSLFYGSISVCAIIGNTLVIWIVSTTRQMQTVTNLLIANLAVADVIIAMFAIPFEFQSALLQRWTLPKFMCAFCPFVKYVSVKVSVFTLTAIAVDRHRAILNPFRARQSKYISKVIIAVIWVTAVALSIPIAFALRVIPKFNSDDEYYASLNDTDYVHTLYCTNVNFTAGEMQAYRYILAFVQYIIPLCVISFVYIQMAIRLWSSKTPGNAQNSRDMALLKNKKKVIKMLIIVVILFSVCWLPLQTYNIVHITWPDINYYHYMNIIWFCCDWLAMSNSCYNPFIYGIYNEKFKREFRKRFPMWRHLGFDNAPISSEYSQDKTISMHTYVSSTRSSLGGLSTQSRKKQIVGVPPPPECRPIALRPLQKAQQDVVVVAVTKSNRSCHFMTTTTLTTTMAAAQDGGQHFRYDAMLGNNYTSGENVANTFCRSCDNDCDRLYVMADKDGVADDDDFVVGTLEL